MNQEELGEFLRQGDWRRVFDAGALTRGAKVARARQVSRVRAEVLKTGDVEIVALVTEKNGESFNPAVAIWEEGGALMGEGDCSCAVGTNCEHAAAVLEYLAGKNEARLGIAFGENPHVEKMTQGQNLQVDEEEAEEVVEEVKLKGGDGIRVQFVLNVERRADGERLAWLPEVYASVRVLYGDHGGDLVPAGNAAPIVTAEGKIHRDRMAEMQALKMLYAIDLVPGAEQPPQSLRKLDSPQQAGTLWAPDRKKWPQAEFYWQRFYHEAAPSLQRRGWVVNFAPQSVVKPLVFRTDTWRAEIVDEGRGWFHLSAGFEVDGEKFELQPILAALVENRFLEVTEGLAEDQEFMIFLPDGRGLALPVGRFRRILIMLRQLSEFNFTGGPIKLNKVDAALLAEEEGLEVEVPKEVEELALRLADFEKIESVEVPDGMLADLRDYQLQGFYWMQFLCRFGLNGILADDMGLGKTLQTLTHILAEKVSGKNEGRPCLVIAPTSVVENWQREAAKFAPGLRVLVLQGSDRKRRFDQIPTVDIVMTSFALIARDLEIYEAQHFYLLVLDEAQHIKNPAAQVTRAVSSLVANHRLCLSGTPIENNLGELWSLMNFLMPGFLGSQEGFNEKYRQPIEKSGSQAKSEALARRVMPLILRRTKQEVAKELPPKTEIMHSVVLNEAQKDLYETVRSLMDKQVRQAMALQGHETQIVFLDALLKLRQICCHPQLLKDADHQAASAKFEYLVDLLDTLRKEKHRVLIFSQFTSMLALIEAHLVEEGVEYLKLTGATQDRQTLVERFQGGEGEVFLISLKAGGTGLTLTGADNVIHYDPWWNPAVENQATDRAYRIGQDKPVFVHKLICKDTVEERIQKMQAKKGDLADDLLAGAGRSLSLTAETLSELLGGGEEPEH
ncbi:MAG: DEAD/DEAH box helicase [Verrucomicrobiota bacterium]